MRIAVCEASPRMVAGDERWKHLVRRVKAERPDIFLMNEMPVGKWVAASPTCDAGELQALHRQHDDAMDRLTEFGISAVLGTRATSEDDKSVNEAFIRTSNGDVHCVHTKQFFPNEAGFYEARWFERGNMRFGTGTVGDLRIGFLICTDVMFNEWARHYGRKGVHLIAVPRATPPGSEHRWRSMMAAAAIVSGCYVASSNRGGIAEDGQEFAGRGWIFGPTGELLAETTSEVPVVSAELDVASVERAQSEYPCYVEDLD
ncbi:MAG: carbon-nitrogen hydrolase family protein [Gemmatimonadales bacterium]